MEPARIEEPEPPERIEADAQAYWSESDTEGTVRDMSHWRGEGRWDEEAWADLGRRHVFLFEQLCARAGVRPSTIRTMVEWGSGGGANAVAFCGRLERFYGVDISAANLQECRRQVDKERGEGFRTVWIPVGQPEHCLQTIETPVDFFLSTAVYQHFPSKPYGERVTRLAARLLRPGGLALIQIRYDDGSERLRPKDRDYRRNVTFFNSYRPDEFAEIALAAGFTVLHVPVAPNAYYAYYYLQKRPTLGQEAPGPRATGRLASV